MDGCKNRFNSELGDEFSDKVFKEDLSSIRGKEILHKYRYIIVGVPHTQLSTQLEWTLDDLLVKHLNEKH